MDIKNNLHSEFSSCCQMWISCNLTQQQKTLGNTEKMWVSKDTGAAVTRLTYNARANDGVDEIEAGHGDAGRLLVFIFVFYKVFHVTDAAGFWEVRRRLQQIEHHLFSLYSKITPACGGELKITKITKRVVSEGRGVHHERNANYRHQRCCSTSAQQRKCQAMTCGQLTSRISTETVKLQRGGLVADMEGDRVPLFCCIVSKNPVIRYCCFSDRDS